MTHVSYMYVHISFPKNQARVYISYCCKPRQCSEGMKILLREECSRAQLGYLGELSLDRIR